MTLDIIIDMDQVKIEGSTVMRPASVSRSEWLEAWTYIQDILTRKKK
jgi:hypothetical protein